MESLFVDTDVCLDLLSERPQFYRDAAQLFTQADKKKIKIQVSALTFSNLHYILRQEHSAAECRKILIRFKVLVEVLNVNDKIIELALQSDFRDFEDAIQYFTALEHSSKTIVTRNLKDYKLAAIPVLPPSLFLKILGLS